jgi:hypothetical protein
VEELLSLYQLEKYVLVLHPNPLHGLEARILLKVISYFLSSNCQGNITSLLKLNQPKWQVFAQTRQLERQIITRSLFSSLLTIKARSDHHQPFILGVEENGTWWPPGTF